MEDLKHLEEVLHQYEEDLNKIETNIDELCKIKSEYLKSINITKGAINEIIADEWRKNAAEGKFRFIYYSDIPKNILTEWYKLEEKFKQGCTGDPYDGCRGCKERCQKRAKDEFMKMYKIKEIKYGCKEENTNNK